MLLLKHSCSCGLSGEQLLTIFHVRNHFSFTDLTRTSIYLLCHNRSKRDDYIVLRYSSSIHVNYLCGSTGNHLLSPLPFNIRKTKTSNYGLYIGPWCFWMTVEWHLVWEVGSKVRKWSKSHRVKILLKTCYKDLVVGRYVPSAEMLQRDESPSRSETDGCTRWSNRLLLRGLVVRKMLTFKH